MIGESIPHFGGKITGGGDNVSFQQNTFVQFIVTRPIMNLCIAA